LSHLVGQGDGADGVAVGQDVCRMMAPWGSPHLTDALIADLRVRRPRQ